MSTFVLIAVGWSALALFAGIRIGRWLKSNDTQFDIIASNSIDAADLPIVEHEEFPINSGA